MLDLNTIFEFSRNNCVAICTFLVPANLLATLLTIAFAVLHRPLHQVWQSAAVASLFAFVMVLHVYTWFSIGVVMAPTYVLLWLAICCLLTNFGAIWFWQHHRNLPQLRA